MQFVLTEEQQLVSDTVRKLLEKEWDPRRDQALSSAHAVDGPVWRQLAELGLLGVALPESHGGSGLGAVALSVLCAEFGRQQWRAPFLASAVLAGTALAQAPQGQVRDHWLRQLAEGHGVLTLAALEADAGYDYRAIALTARATSTGWRLDGRKHVVMDAACADAFLVTCRIDEAPALVLLEKDHAGLEAALFTAFDGTSLATLTLTDVALPESAVIARGPAAHNALDAALAHAALAAASETLGACDGAFERTLDYLRLREQFGTRLATFQALRHRASDLHADLEMLRSLVWGAADGLMRDPRHGDAFAALALAVPVGDRVCREAIQLHGGIGMTQELGIGRYLLRVNALSRLFGDATHNGWRYLESLEDEHHD